jgi:hypothetical protein
MNLYGYVANDPVNAIDPTGEWGVAGALYGAIAGGVGGYLSTGTVAGAAAGAVGGAVVGFVAPQLSGAAGGAFAAAAASTVGQIAGQVGENVVARGDKPWTAGLSIDLPAVAGAAATGPFGSSFKSAATSTVGVIRGPVIGKELGKESVSRVPGKAVGAVGEGAVTGGGELVGDQGGNLWESVTEIPTNLRITDSNGNLDIGFSTNDEVKAARK